MKQSITSLLTFGLMAGAVMGQDWAKTRLDKSPRHLEWVKVNHGERVVNCFIAYPQVKDPATAVVVIHENLGLTDWVAQGTVSCAPAKRLMPARPIRNSAIWLGAAGKPS